jgi:hypothetical protein
MRIYRKLCYMVENVFVKFLTRKQDPVKVKMKVEEFRLHKEAMRKERWARIRNRKKVINA